MATFEYEALTAEGRLMKGTLAAATPDEAGAVLRGMQLDVRSVAEVRPAGPRTPIGRSEFLLFNEQLAAIARAGIPLERSLRELSGEIGSARMRKLVAALADDLEAGTSIEDAFAARARHFPPLYGRIVEAGVRTGRLAEMLTSLSRHLHIAGGTRRVLIEALTYPLVVLALSMVVLTVLLLWVTPMFESLYETFNFQLPALTRGAMWMSRHFLWFGGGVAAVVVLFVAARLVLRTFPDGRWANETILMNMPGLGGVVRAALLARLADAMATLVEAGCDMPACLRLGAEASGSERLKREADVFARHVEAGGELAGLTAAGTIVPGMFIYSMQVGAERNELADNLHTLADMYAGQARAAQGRLQALLTPAMLIAVGMMVALGVVAMFAPLPALLNSMQM